MIKRRVGGGSPRATLREAQKPMQRKYDADASTAEKALRLYQKLLLDGRRHFQTDLAEYLNCSVQTVMRLIAEIEGIIGACLACGLEKRRRRYQIRSVSRNRLGLDFEELRYLSICRDLAAPYLPEQIKKRVDQSIFSFSLLMADTAYAEREKVQKPQLVFHSKGLIDYSPHFAHLESLVKATEEKRICLARYKAAGSKESKEHRFAPHRMVSMSNALYDLGASVADDFRSFRHFLNLAVHRIEDVTLTDKP